MRHKFRYALLFLMVWVLVLPPPAQAKSPAAVPLDGKIIMGGSYTLQSGEQMDGDLVIFGGSVTIERGANVKGDVALFGGSLDVAGTVQGDVVIFGGSASLRDSAVVQGDLASVGGDVSRAEGAYIGGEVVTEQAIPFNFNWQGRLPYTYEYTVGGYTGPFNRMVNFFLSVMWFIFQVCMVSALAVLVLMFLEAPVQRIGEVVQTQALLSGGVGCLSLLVVPALLVVLGLTILLLPVSFIGFLGLVLLALYGWVTMGYEVGRRVAEALGQSWSAPVAAGVGTGLFTLIAGGIGRVLPWCIGWVVPVFAVSIGVGAVILTRFGTRPYPDVPLSSRLPADMATEPPEAESSPDEEATRASDAAPSPELPPADGEQDSA